MASKEKPLSKKVIDKFESEFCSILDESWLRKTKLEKSRCIRRMAEVSNKIIEHHGI